VEGSASSLPKSKFLGTDKAVPSKETLCQLALLLCHFGAFGTVFGLVKFGLNQHFLLYLQWFNGVFSVTAPSLLGGTRQSVFN